ncbi:MAG: DUF418 domain-containing protein [Pseudomonadota bacterium]
MNSDEHADTDGSVPVSEPSQAEAESLTEALAPAASGERIGSLDFIRGIAVMGILAANIIVFGQPFVAYVDPSTFLVDNGDPDGWMWLTQFTLIDGKMRGLFSVLFGAGLYLFMERAWERGASRWLQARRLGWLGLFGLIHFYFIWKGDILFLYSVCGLASLMFIRMKPTNQMVLGMIGYVFGALAYSALFVSLYAFTSMEVNDDADLAAMQTEMGSAVDELLAEGAVETALKQSGDYAGFVANNFSEHGTMPLELVVQVFIETIPLMLIGMALYRMGFFSGGFARRKMVLWGWAGLVGGGLVSLGIGLWTQSTGMDFFATNLSMLGTSVLPRLAMVLGFAALLAVYSPGWTGWLGQRVSAAGRAAFTNYLGTSILMLFVFHGWALGLFGSLNRPQLYLVTVLAWVTMLAWSKPWLDRYRYGPLEWLWRCLTYGKVFPLRR